MPDRQQTFHKQSLNRHEIPFGVKDYIPPESYKIKEIENIILNIFRQWGYRYIITPLLEYLPVYTDGDTGFEEDELIKVIERETGKTMVLRADFTPQIARIVSSKMAINHAPIKLSYSGIVVKHSRNKGKKEIYQAGIELINAKGIDADAEIITIAGEVLKRLGLKDFVISLSHAGFIRMLVDRINPQSDVSGIVELLMQKDYTGINSIEGLSKKQKDTLNALFELYGKPDKIMSRARRIFDDTKLNLFFKQIEDILRIIKGFGLDNRVILDLREMHSIDYHTGIVFQIFTPGYGEELINGGRYDGFLKRYGSDLPATGLGINISAMMPFLNTINRKKKKSKRRKL